MLNGVRLLSEGSLSGDTWEARLPVELRSLRQLRRRKVRIREQSDRRALPSRQSIVPRSATPFPGTRARMTTGSGSSVEQRERVKWATCQIFWPLIEFVPFANSIATTCSRFGGLSGRSGGRRRSSMRACNGRGITPFRLPPDVCVSRQEHVRTVQWSSVLLRPSCLRRQLVAAQETIRTVLRRQGERQADCLCSRCRVRSVPTRTLWRIPMVGCFYWRTGGLSA